VKLPGVPWKGSGSCATRLSGIVRRCGRHAHRSLRRIHHSAQRSVTVCREPAADNNANATQNQQLIPDNYGSCCIVRPASCSLPHCLSFIS
jgi:hypothetical protein